MKTDQEIEEYLGTRDCLRNESPLTVWCAQKILLLMKRNQELFEDSTIKAELSSIGMTILQMIREDKRHAMEKLVCHLESLSQSVTNEKLFFDLKQTPKKKIYRILAQIVPYMEDDQQMLYSYFCDHSNLDIQPASLKNSVYYWMKKKVQKSYK